jgi:excisionase family DNA binding protein
MRTTSTTDAPYPPTMAEVEMAQDINRRLADTVEGGGSIRLHLGAEQAGDGITLSPTAVRALSQVFQQLGRGQAVTVLPVDAELTSQEAADLLLISRPSLIQLLDEGALPYRRLGTHRRLLLADVLAYKQAHAARRRAVLDELAAHDQALGLE